MMDIKQVNEALEKLFQEERIVFWNDPELEFVQYLTGSIFSPVEGVKVIRLDHTAALCGVSGSSCQSQAQGTQEHVGVVRWKVFTRQVRSRKSNQGNEEGSARLEKDVNVDYSG